METRERAFLKEVKQMAITIEDVAKEAKVSTATVSRVINGTKAVSPELKQRVLDAIERNRFKPNSFAKGLATDKSNIIGVIVSDVSNTVISTAIKGINSVFQKKGYTVMICESNGNGKKEKMLLERMQEQRASGVLLAGVNIDSELVAWMEKRDYPVVLFTQAASDGQNRIHTVIHDNRKIVSDAVDFLAGNGHRQIAFISGPDNDYSSGILRREGFVEAIRQHGFELPDSYLVCGGFTYESGMNAMQKIYEENITLPTAVLACCDMTAVGAVACINRFGMKVPEDMSVMGIDDIELSMYVTPALSTVRIPYYEEGRMAAEKLLGLIENGKDGAEQLTLVPHKVIRRFSVKNIGNMVTVQSCRNE